MADNDKQTAMLKKIQEMEFVAVELNLYLDTHPYDEDALNDFNCAVEMLKRCVKEYQEVYGPLLNYGFGGYAKGCWQWIEGLWPWEM